MKIILSNGTLYGALTSLLDQGLIERLRGDESPGLERPRKAYHWSNRGSVVLDAEISCLENMLKRARWPMAKEIP